MVLRDSVQATTELDKLAAQELDGKKILPPRQHIIEWLKRLVSRGDDKSHVELHLGKLEVRYPNLDTSAVRAAL